MNYKRIFISELADDFIKQRLLALCEKLVIIKPNPVLPLPVGTHADMQLLKIDDTLILTKELFGEISENLPDNLIISFSDYNHTDKYPGDVNLNALYVNNKLLASVNALDPAVSRLCHKKSIDIINVKQGYTRCSTLVINDNAIITADKGIADAALSIGLDVLRISSGGIKLDGYDYGFVGGASFFDFVDNTVYFFGDLESHQDCEAIYEFCKKHNTKIISCGAGPLVDIGGAVAI